MHQVASAARALVALLDKAGDLLAFDKTLMTETEVTASAPGSPEWEAAVLADLAALPPHLLQRASQRASGE